MVWRSSASRARCWSRGSATRRARGSPGSAGGGSRACAAWRRARGRAKPRSGPSRAEGRWTKSRTGSPCRRGRRGEPGCWRSCWARSPRGARGRCRRRPRGRRHGGCRPCASGGSRFSWWSAQSRVEARRSSSTERQGCSRPGDDALGQIRWIAVRAPLRISMSMFESPLIDGRTAVVTSSRRSASAAASRDSRSSVTR